MSSVSIIALIGWSDFNWIDILMTASVEKENEILGRLLRSSRKWKSHTVMEKL